MAKFCNLQTHVQLSTAKHIAYFLEANVTTRKERELKKASVTKMISTTTIHKFEK